VKIDQYGQVSITEQEAFNSLYTNKSNTLENVYIDSISVIEQYNNAQQTNADKIPSLKVLQDLDLSIEEFDKANQENWFMPDKYKNMDIEGFLVDQCPKENYDRLVEELMLFRQHNMIPLLRYLKYLVDTMRENNIVWGVGRGSSVASYALYLIGVHKIDSIKYNLDIREFLK
jgi:DNA polymerase III alpha subunit